MIGPNGSGNKDIREIRRILTINCGSSSLKFALYQFELMPHVAGAEPHASHAAPLRAETLVYTGALERIGLPDGRFHVADGNQQTVAQEERKFQDQSTALHHALDWLEKQADAQPPDAIGHRIVHGGPAYSQPQRITPEVLLALRRLAPLAPTHAPAEIAAIETLAGRYPTIPQVACFDTAFHRQMPRVAQLYGLPQHFFDEGILRYGFHGLSYEYIVSQLAGIRASARNSASGESTQTQIADTKETADERIIIAHLGNGASMVAVQGGQSLDTTMGFTPLGGLVMSTRSGDLDPGVLLYLLEAEKRSPTEIRRLVEQEGGLLGLSGTSSDMRDLLGRAHQDPRAEEAVAVFCYTARKQLGGLVSVLGGLDTLVFTGGIGEHAAEVRRRICDGLLFLGVRLDPVRNTADAAIISADDSQVIVRIIPTNEELIIARHTVQVLGSQEHTPG
jgi:acetate kinase